MKANRMKTANRSANRQGMISRLVLSACLLAAAAGCSRTAGQPAGAATAQQQPSASTDALGKALRECEAERKTLLMAYRKNWEIVMSGHVLTDRDRQVIEQLGHRWTTSTITYCQLRAKLTTNVVEAQQLRKTAESVAKTVPMGGSHSRELELKVAQEKAAQQQLALDRAFQAGRERQSQALVNELEQARAAEFETQARNQAFRQAEEVRARAMRRYTQDQLGKMAAQGVNYWQPPR